MAALDLTLLKSDGEGVEPNGNIGEVLALGCKCNLVGGDELVWVA